MVICVETLPWVWSSLQLVIRRGGGDVEPRQLLSPEVIVKVST